MKTFFWIILLALSANLSAQSSYVFRDGEVTKGQVTKLKNQMSNNTITLSYDGVVYQIRHEKMTIFNPTGSPVMTSYDLATMNPITRRDLELSFNDKTLMLENAAVLAGEIVIFSSFYNKKDDKKYIFAQTIDKKTLAPQNNLKKIGEIGNIVSSARADQSGVRFLYSQDSSKIAIVTEAARKRKDFEAINISIIDQNRNIIWNKDIELPYEEVMFNIEDYCINQQGDVFVIGYLFNEKPRTKVKGKPNYSYKILRYNADGSQKEYDIKLADKFVSTLRAYAVGNDALVCAGFYNNKNHYSIAGTFYASLDLTTNQFIKESYREFDSKLLENTLSDKELKRYKRREEKGKDVELPQYTFRNLVRRSDGGAILIGENYYVRIVHSGSGRNRTTNYYYHYHNIFVANVSPSGDIEWVTFIPKRQITANDGGYFSSFVFAVRKDKMYFIFNDDLRNIPYDKNKRLRNMSASSKYGATSITSLDTKGNQERFELTKHSDTKTVILAKSSIQISDSDVIFVARPVRVRKKQVALQRLTFK